MIPWLSVMIGAYIVTRMIDLIRREVDRADGPTVAAYCGVLCIAVAVVAVVSIVSAGADVSRTMGTLDSLGY